MADITPTVTAINLHQYREQIERISQFASRIHIDLMDGIFAPTISPGFKHTWWPKESLQQVDVHIMYENPLLAVKYLVNLRPQLIILHAEANHEEVSKAFELIDTHGPIKRGLAILQETKPSDVTKWLKQCDHCLIFSGNLGHFGGKVDMKQTEKIGELLDINPNLEIGWDGGINGENAAELIEAGVDVLNVGGFIQQSANPGNAYAILQQIASKPK